MLRARGYAGQLAYLMFDWVISGSACLVIAFLVNVNRLLIQAVNYLFLNCQRSGLIVQEAGVITPVCLRDDALRNL